MSINLICSVCHKTHSIKDKTCFKCGSRLTSAKYKVRIKDKSTGKWKSKTVPTLSLAKKFEDKFKTEDIIKEQALSLVPIVDSPTVNETCLCWNKA